MKKTMLRLLICTVLAGLLSVTAWAGSGLRVSAESLLVEAGGTAVFSVTADDAAGRIDLAVSDPEVVALSEKTSWLDRSRVDYTVTGLKSGRCTITVTYTDVATYQEEVVTGSAAVDICVPCDRHTYSENDHRCTVCGWEAVSVEGLDIRPEYLYGFYTGSPVCPDVTVRDGDRVLVRDADYTVSYLDHVDIGVATVRITGINAYRGQKDARFEIRPGNVSTVRVAATDKDRVTLTWQASAGSDGYTVFELRDGRLFEVGTTENTRYEVTGLAVNRQYQFRIRPFATVEETAQRLDGTFQTTYWSTRYSAVVTAETREKPKPDIGGGDIGGGSGGSGGGSSASDGKGTNVDEPIQPPRFADVTGDAYFYQPVLWAASMGITDGVDEAHFAPNATCTRAQTVTFLWRAAGCPEPLGTGKHFGDVDDGAYYAKAVQWAVEQGITKGVDDSRFDPEATVSRGQVVAFLYRASHASAQAQAVYSDVPADAYYAAAVSYAAAEGITNGVGGDRFAPEADCTRGQIVTFLYRAYVK